MAAASKFTAPYVVYQLYASRLAAICRYESLILLDPVRHINAKGWPNTKPQRDKVDEASSIVNVVMASRNDGRFLEAALEANWRLR